MKIKTGKKKIQHRQVKRIIKKAAFFLILTAILICFIQFLNSGTFKVKYLDCQKEGLECSQKEKQFLADLKGENIFLLNSQKEEEEIKAQLLWIKSIKIKKILPSQLDFELVTRKALVGITTDERTWFLADREGFVFEQLAERPEELMSVYAASRPKIAGKLEGELMPIIKLAQHLQEEFIVVKKASLDFPTITLFLEKSTIASFSSEKAIDLQVASLQFILRRSKIEGKLPKFIDLRFKKPVIRD